MNSNSAPLAPRPRSASSQADKPPSLRLVERYEAGAPLVGYAIAHLTSEQLTTRLSPGTWSIAEVVVHLLDSELTFSDRFKRILAETDPVLQAFDESRWLVEIPPHELLPLEEAAQMIELNRRWTARILKRLQPADFGRSGRHSVNGRVTLASILAYAVGHLDHHLRFLYGKRGNLGSSIEPRYTPDVV
ncbi:hypothetical protein Isop_0184 [Isosphaera pallida ATCC 43644]|jgi:uncharacterized damage-inducible protein DinB|uniref:DinB-like domain-containing protein n=1 Tax=Isosphaera pallida (strain ATCC 43644 / DSM 9630 / IS1B) TaxID=575540 RepID=E8R686_ISOPI|nr:DinB family protein [Isosphaera pallida]ADV60781.1 hypothetical protein Isop_0184 [Isosphaera pallida ATCC 43644]